MVDAYLNGIFPRSKALISATRGLDRGRVSEHEAHETLLSDIRDLVALQQGAGFSYLSDGLLNWQDLFRPLVEAWEGLELGGLTRWFDNNTFYRQPMIVGPLEPRPIDAEFARTDLLPESHDRQAVLPGPYTFLTLSENHYYSSPGDALQAITEGLRTAAGALKDDGFGLLHFQEPGLAVRPPNGDGLADLQEAYGALKFSGAETGIHLFFGSAQPLLPELLDFPVDLVGLDLYQEDLEQLKEIDFTKALACGCVDGRNSHMEDPSEVAALVERLRVDLSPPEVALVPNADLEFLPRGVARAKVEVLGAAKKQLEDGT